MQALDCTKLFVAHVVPHVTYPLSPAVTDLFFVHAVLKDPMRPQADSVDLILDLIPDRMLDLADVRSLLFLKMVAIKQSNWMSSKKNWIRFYRFYLI